MHNAVPFPTDNGELLVRLYSKAATLDFRVSTHLPEHLLGLLLQRYSHLEIISVGFYQIDFKVSVGFSLLRITSKSIKANFNSC